MSFAKRCQECERFRDAGDPRYLRMIHVEAPPSFALPLSKEIVEPTEHLHFCDAWCLYCWVSKNANHPKLKTLREGWKKDVKTKAGTRA